MGVLTKKYIFMQKLKGERIEIYSAYYSDKAHTNTWMRDLDLLAECGCVTYPQKNGTRSLLHDLAVYYPSDSVAPARVHNMNSGTTLSAPLKGGAYDHNNVRDTLSH